MGAGVHGVGVLAGGTVEWVVVCRRLECWLEEMLLHRSWCFQEIAIKLHDIAGTLVFVRCSLPGYNNRMDPN